MRQISPYRPFAKVRNPGRRIRALNRWAATFEGFFPDLENVEHCEYWKIPVLDRLVNPPTTTPEIQGQCAQALIDAAAHIARSRPAESEARAAALFEFPRMFYSEVCVFKSADILRWFMRRTSLPQIWTRLPPERSLSQELNLKLPEGFSEVGFHELIEHEDEDQPNGMFVYEGEQWLIGEMPS